MMTIIMNPDSLGVDHDGENNNCKSKDNFIMSSTSNDGFHNSFYFSKCSIDAMERITHTLDNPW